jgi:hypothetical protein
VTNFAKLYIPGTQVNIYPYLLVRRFLILHFKQVHSSNPGGPALHYDCLLSHSAGVRFMFGNLLPIQATIFTSNTTLPYKHGQFFTLSTNLTIPYAPSTRNPSTNLQRTPQQPHNRHLPNTQRRIPHSPFLPSCSRNPLSTFNMPSNVRYPSLTLFAYRISQCVDITKPLR